MSAKSQHNNILHELSLILVVVIVGLIGSNTGRDMILFRVKLRYQNIVFHLNFQANRRTMR